MNDKILWGQIAAVGAIVILAVWAATQWTAAALGYQPALGAPWFRIGDYPVYPPPAFFWWWFVYDAYAPPLFYRGAMIGHIKRKFTVPVGQPAEMDARAGTLRLLSAAVL